MSTLSLFTINKYFCVCLIIAISRVIILCGLGLNIQGKSCVDRSLKRNLDEIEHGCGCSLSRCLASICRNFVTKITNPVAGNDSGTVK